MRTLALIATLLATSAASAQDGDARMRLQLSAPVIAGGTQADPGTGTPEPTELSREYHSETSPCGDGLVGDRTRTVTTILMSDQTVRMETGEWDSASCTPNSVIKTITEFVEVNSVCGTFGYDFARGSRIVEIYADGTITDPPFSEPVSNCQTGNKTLNQYEFRPCVGARAGQEYRYRQVQISTNQRPLWIGFYTEWRDTTCYF
jgi:hypothetical protein